MELNDKIETKIKKIDLSKFKGTLQPLIKKDIEEILKYL